MGQGLCWCGGRERLALSICGGPKVDLDVSPGSGTPARASTNPKQTSRRALDNKAMIKSESLFTQTRLALSRRASTEEADARWQATKEEWESSLRAALEQQGESTAGREEEAVSQDDERLAALAMFKTVTPEEEKQWQSQIYAPCQDHPEDGEKEPQRQQQEKPEAPCTDALQGASGDTAVLPGAGMLDEEASPVHQTGADNGKEEEHDDSPVAMRMECVSPSSMIVNHEETHSPSPQSKGIREGGEASDGMLERRLRSAGGA